jgi:hypothetical protein
MAELEKGKKIIKWAFYDLVLYTLTIASAVFPILRCFILQIAVIILMFLAAPQELPLISFVTAFALVVSFLFAIII